MQWIWRGVVAGAIVLAACGGDDGPDEPYMPTWERLAGTIGGVPWTFTGGESGGSYLPGDDEYFVDLYAESFVPCGTPTPSQTDHLSLLIPNDVGEFDLSFSHGVSFIVHDGNGSSANLLATQGTLRVRSIGPDTLTGYLRARYDDDNEVEGKFTVTLCFVLP